MTSISAVPSSSIDLFADIVLDDPYPVYATLREMGSVVYLNRLGVWAIPRYAEVRAVLEDPDTFSSASVALNDIANGIILAGTVLATDGKDHARLRRVLSRQLAPRSVKGLANWIQRLADQLVADVVQRGRFDAVSDLAVPFVGSVIMHLMGVHEQDRDRLVTLAEGTFSAFGPADSPRTIDAFPLAEAMLGYIAESATRDQVRPGSWLAEMYAAADRGEIGEYECVSLASAYTVAGADTTIHAITTLIHLLASQPKLWKYLHTHVADPQVFAATFHEGLRYDSPVQWFCRVTTRDIKIGGTPISTGSQVMLLYGSANRDHDQWGTTADQFHIHRRGTLAHLALGNGPHSCAGNHLAQMEAVTLLRSLAHACAHLHLDPDTQPRRQLNNVLRGWHSVPVHARCNPTNEEHT